MEEASDEEEERPAAAPHARKGAGTLELRLVKVQLEVWLSADCILTDLLSATLMHAHALSGIIIHLQIHSSRGWCLRAQVEEATGEVRLRLAEGAAAAGAAAAPGGEDDDEDDDEDESLDEEVYDVAAFRQELDAMEAEGEDAAAQAEAAKW
jgi:hypothetical protein